MKIRECAFVIPNVVLIAEILTISRNMAKNERVESIHHQCKDDVNFFSNAQQLERKLVNSMGILLNQRLGPIPFKSETHLSDKNRG